MKRIHTTFFLLQVFVALCVLPAILATAEPGGYGHGRSYGRYGYGHQAVRHHAPKCRTVYDTVTRQSCATTYEAVCNTETITSYV